MRSSRGDEASVAAGEQRDTVEAHEPRRFYWMPCAEQGLLRQEHWAAVQNFRAAIRDMVLLVDNSATDSNFNLGHRRIRAARRACEVARDAIEHHQEKHGC